MTLPTIISGNIPNSAQNTPTGQPKAVAVDNPYMEKDEFLQSSEAAGLGITTTSDIYTSGQLDRIMLVASSMVNRHCRRFFDTQTIDETKTGFTVRPYNPQLVTVVLANRPYQQINSIYIQVLKWFVQVVSSGNQSYLQDFPDLGYYKIVPMLSSAGTGLGTPIPSAILDRIPLGVLWTNYTFGYGQNIANLTTNQIGATQKWQSPVGYRLWAPSKGITVYDGATIVLSTNYTVDYPNGTVTFAGGYTVNSPLNVTVTITTNEAVAFDIKQATSIAASYLINTATDNPLGATSFSIQTYSVSFGSDNLTKQRFHELLEPYVSRTPKII
jgi:hypothetical protein